MTIHKAHRSDKGGHHNTQPNSRAGRIRAFFVANPDEELTFDQIAVKFDCTIEQARFAVRDVAKTVDIESVHIIRMRAKGVAR